MCWWHTFFIILIIFTLTTSLEKEADVTTSQSRSANDYVDRFSWMVSLSNSCNFSRSSCKLFSWIIIIVHCCLLLWLTYVRFLETVNNGFLWYNIPWWYQVFHCLENTNLWKQFVALHCFDTGMNNFLLVMGFETSYYTLVHCLKNRHCIWMQENQVDVHEVFDFRVSSTIVNQKGNLSALSSKGWVDFSYPFFQ